jgi:hypothetical protein
MNKYFYGLIVSCSMLASLNSADKLDTPEIGSDLKRVIKSASKLPLKPLTQEEKAEANRISKKNEKQKTNNMKANRDLKKQSFDQ